MLRLVDECGQGQTAKRLGFSQAYVSRLVRGEVARLRAVTVKQIARVVEGDQEHSLADALACVVRSVVDVGASPEHAKRTKLVGALDDATGLVSALSVALRQLEDGAP
ncbi:MAG: hypothetical protein R3B99_35910 [Polyangiales bacterium]|nr:hypothetical protein [Sandaracinus sp.]